MACRLTPTQIAEYHEQSFTIARKLFAPTEIALLVNAMEHDPSVRSHILDRLDGEGRATRIALWNRAGDSVYGLAARSARMVDTCEALLGGPIYHYQSKLTAKDPRVGGAWEWHQDYGYWYHNGCLRPDLLSCMIALDASTRANGCLQIVRGSHHLGRIDHVPLTAGQNEVDPERMKYILARHEIAHCELDPGDVLIFHSNSIHRSDQNRSESRRWTLLICYNRVDNDTVTRSDDRYYVPLDKVPDDALLAAGARFSRGDDQEHFASKPYVPDLQRAS